MQALGSSFNLFLSLFVSEEIYEIKPFSLHTNSLCPPYLFPEDSKQKTEVLSFQLFPIRVSIKLFLYQPQILGLLNSANFLWFVMTFTTASAISIYYSPGAS